MDGYNGGFRRRESIAPVKVGEEIDVKIEAVGEKGDGIAKKKGFVLFVPNTKQNDEVRIRITKVLNKVGFAEAIGEAQGPIEEDSQPEKRNNDVEFRVERAAPKRDEFDVGSIDTSNDSEDFGEEEDDEATEEQDDNETTKDNKTAEDGEVTEDETVTEQEEATDDNKESQDEEDSEEKKEE